MMARVASQAFTIHAAPNKKSPIAKVSSTVAVFEKKRDAVSKARLIVSREDGATVYVRTWELDEFISFCEENKHGFIFISKDEKESEVTKRLLSIAELLDPSA